MKYLFTLSILFFALFCEAQDIIVKKDKTILQAKVLEIGIIEIRFLNFNNLTGPEYMIPKSEVSSIQFSNGTIESFDLTSQENGTATPLRNFKTMRVVKIKKDYTSNILLFHFLDFVRSNYTLSYERIIQSGKFGIKIPVRIGSTSGDRQSKIFHSGGLDLNYYPTGQGKIKYYVGPGIEIGSGRNYTYDLTDFIFLERVFKPGSTLFISGYLNNGALFQLSKSLTFGSSLGVGIKNYSNNDSNTINNNSFQNGKYYLALKLDFNLGFRF